MVLPFQAAMIGLTAVTMVTIMIMLDKTSRLMIDLHHDMDHPYVYPENYVGHNVIFEPTDVCQGAHNVILYVLTTPDNKENRDLIRESWGDSVLLDSISEPFRARVVFVMGKVANYSVNTQRMLRMEHELHGDILVGDFNDSYELLTQKGMFFLRWLNAHCRRKARIDFVLKSDDDVYVNMYRIFNYMRRARTASTLCHFICVVFQNVTVPTDGKWTLTKDEYPHAKFPTYCQGLSYIICQNGLNLLWDKLRRVQETPLRLEDVYLTSLLPRYGEVSLDLNYDRLPKAFIMQKPQNLKSETFYETLIVHKLPRSEWRQFHNLLDEYNRGMTRPPDNIETLIKAIRTASKLEETDPEDY